MSDLLLIMGCIVEELNKLEGVADIRIGKFNLPHLIDKPVLINIRFSFFDKVSGGSSQVVMFLLGGDLLVVESIDYGTRQYFYDVTNPDFARELVGEVVGNLNVKAYQDGE